MYNCGYADPCKHSFNAINDVCDKCGHGFFFYESDNIVEASHLDQFFGKNNQTASILSYFANNGKGYIEFDVPVKTIGNRAFADCNISGCLKIGKSVESIGIYAFSKCCANKLIIPHTVKQIDIRAFFGCPNLREVEVYWHKPISINWEVFLAVDLNKVKLTVPEMFLSEYQSSDVWKNFGTIEGVPHIHKYADSRDAGEDYYTCIICGLLNPVRQHEHNYEVSEVRTDWHVCLCTSEVGECIAPEIIESHNLEVVDGTYVCSVCGWTHEHNYTLLLHDDTHHWQACVGEGECNARTTDKVEHTYNEEATKGSVEYYTCSVCGYEDAVRQHVHNYEWVFDEHQHKQVCSSEVGTCIAREIDVAEHNLHESILCDTENYHCNVCGYTNETLKTQFDARDYFSLKAIDGDVTLGMQKTGAPDDCTLQVSADGNNWSEPMTLSETTANIATIPSGETRYFRRGSTTAADRISDDADNYWTFSMDGSANVEADGNMMSLLDMTCQQSTIANEAAFLYLFKGCTLLKSVTIKSPVLLTCGRLRDIFGGQVTSFIIDTDVTTIGNQLFQNTAITSIFIPEGVTSIGNNSFESCSGLTSIVIPSTVRSIGDNAFYRCRITQYTLNCPSSCAFGDNALSGASGYKIIVPALTTHSWTSNPMWSTYGSHFTEPTFTLHANEDPDNAGKFYTTFYNSHYAYTLPNGVKAYTATIGEENNEKVVMLTAIEGDILPKGTAVLLHSNTTGDMLMTVSNENGNEYGENLFCGVDVETAQSGTNYMLSYGQNGLGFYKMREDMMLSANKTFLPQSAAMANARAFRMVFTDDNEVDGIQQIENGELETENSVIYNLNGMRLDKLQKGINIVNGKKVIVK